MAWTLKGQPGYDEKTAQTLQENLMPTIEAPAATAQQPVVNPIQQQAQAQQQQVNPMAAQMKAAEERRKKILAALMAHTNQIGQPPQQVQG